MDLSKVKMVVTDMDGTLLNSNHQVSDRFFELFEIMKQRGIIFVAASGRQYHSIVDKLQPIKNDIVVIAENGGFAMQRDIELLATPLPYAAKNSVLNVLDSIENIHPVLCGKHNAYIKNNSKEFEAKLREYYTDFKMVDDLKEFDGEILKIAIYHFESSEKYIYPSVAHLEGSLKVKVSGENWVDISSPDAHKGYALQKVQERFNVSPAETMVFGDYNNDLEMLALADFSFAMENAHPNVKKAANYLTAHNDDFGVERILEKLVNAQ
ncbi:MULTISPECIES: HAD family hydrolase [Zobellia]|uniref:HAD family hydrolase n=1 Tax=Zobellia TaxID=112040 RepID=UPI000B52BBDD|nr:MULTISPECIES: HAD family hydrolase [Zobellia]MBU3025869.1 Cof-type HAD-IIB family hydrolase [Zobellia galactanivorans]OWW25355.1 haloacid dehalogenase [Zobellia sp. OII3]